METTRLSKYNQVITSLCQDMQAFCKPLHHLGIDYLSYTRTYNNGERFYLTTSPKIIEDYLIKNKYLLMPNEVRPKYFPKHKIIVWSTLSNQHIFHEAKLMGAGNGIYIFNENNNEYYDSFGFGTSQYNESIINMYFNKLDTLKTLVSTFNHDAADIIKIAENNKVLLPFSDVRIDPYILSDAKLKKDLLLSQLTSRQRECVILLMQGLTAKEIAKELKLSFRTVEAYFQHIKAKLNFKNKYELISKLTHICQ